jgi:hypothetical protein
MNVSRVEARLNDLRHGITPTCHPALIRQFNSGVGAVICITLRLRRAANPATADRWIMTSANSKNEVCHESSESHSDVSNFTFSSGQAVHVIVRGSVGIGAVPIGRPQLAREKKGR